MLMLTHSNPLIIDRIAFDVWHPLDHLQLAFIVRVLNLLGWDSRGAIESILMSLHRLWLLLRVHERHMHVVWATCTLKLLVLLILGVSSLAREPKVDMLVSSTLAEANGLRQINLRWRVTRLIHIRPRAN